MRQTWGDWDEAALLRILRQPNYRIADQSPQPLVADDPPEKALLGEVRKLAKAHGWHCYHTHNSRHSESGFPDVVLARPQTATSPGRLIFAELKSRKGKMTQEQTTWLSLLAHTVPEVEVYLWRPSDLDTILDILTARLGRPHAASLT